MIPDEMTSAFHSAHLLKELVPFMPKDALIDLVCIGNDLCHLALASSSSLAEPVSAALAFVVERDVSIALLRNRSAAIPDFAVYRILEQNIADADVMLALEERFEADLSIWKALIVARMKWIADQSLQPRSKEALMITLLWSSPEAVRPHYIKALAHLQQITPPLLFHALRSGARAIAVELLAQVSTVPTPLVEQALSMRSPAQIQSIARKAGLAEILTDDLVQSFKAMKREEKSLARLAA